MGSSLSAASEAAQIYEGNVQGKSGEEVRRAITTSLATGAIAFAAVTFTATLFGFASAAMLLNATTADTSDDDWQKAALGLGIFTIIILVATMALSIWIMVKANRQLQMNTTGAQRSRAPPPAYTSSDDLESVGYGAGYGGYSNLTI